MPRIGVEVVGEGVPVLLLHGWGGNRELMLPLATRLATHGFACHVLDMPGFGESDMPNEVWDVPRYRDFVRDYLDSVKIPQIHVIGHSFGGRIAILLAAEHPNYVDKLVLLDSAGVKPSPSNKMKLYFLSRRLIFAVLKLPLLNSFEPRVREWFWQRFGSQDARDARDENPILFETFKRVVGQDLVNDARKIAAPTLLIWGEKDEDTPLRDAKILENAIPDAGLVVLEGAGHYAYLEQPDYVVHVLTHFFEAR